MEAPQDYIAAIMERCKPEYLRNLYKVSTWEDDTDFLYKCTAPYAPASEYTLAWDDPSVGVEWPVADLDPIISDKDAVGLALADVPAFD